MKKYIFGGHVAEYMESMEEEEPEKFKEHFKNYLDNDVEADADDIEEMYSKVPHFHSLSCTQGVFRLWCPATWSNKHRLYAQLLRSLSCIAPALQHTGGCLSPFLSAAMAIASSAACRG